MFEDRKWGVFVLLCVAIEIFITNLLDGGINLNSKKFEFGKVRDFLGLYVVDKIQNLQTDEEAFKIWESCFKDFEIYKRLSLKENLCGVLYLCAVGANQLNYKNYHNLISIIYKHIEIFHIKENKRKLTDYQKKLYYWILERLVPYATAFFKDWGNFLFGTPVSITPDEPAKMPLRQELPEHVCSYPDIPLEIAKEHAPVRMRSNTISNPSETR